MEYLIGVLLGAAVCGFGMTVGLDRDRAFYPTVLCVVGTYYILFAVMGASTHVLTIESLVTCGFFTISAVGFKKNLWIVAAGLAGHGVFDFCRHYFIQNPGVPLWWPGFCGSIDVFFGVFLAILLKKRGASEPTLTSANPAATVVSSPKPASS